MTRNIYVRFKSTKDCKLLVILFSLVSNICIHPLAYHVFYEFTSF